MMDIRTIVAALALAVILFLTISSSADADDAPASLWSHNGSTVDLYDFNDRRVFRYVSPRAEMQSEGVATGTILFSGARSGNSYVGTAYVFSARCGTIPYSVTGGVSDDERHIAMSGDAPTTLSNSCRAMSFRRDVLTFDLLQVYASQLPLPELPMTSAQTEITVTTPPVDTSPYQPLGDVDLTVQRAQQTDQATDDNRQQNLATPATPRAITDPKADPLAPTPSPAATISPGQIVLIGVAGLAIATVLGFMIMSLFGKRQLTTFKQHYINSLRWTAPIARAPPHPIEQPPALTNVPAVIPEAPSPALERDTPAALAAMKLAKAFIDELWEGKLPELDDEDGRRKQLNTLSLVSRQIAIVERADPDAVLEDADEHGYSFRLTLNQLKANALYREGLTHRFYDKRKSLKALQRATELSPHSPHMFYMLGIVHILNCNRAKAVAAFERAIELDPDDMANRKELFRAQSMTDSEILTYKVTRTAEKTIETGIRAWNIFAVTYNIVTLPIRIPLKIGNWILRVTRAI